MDNNLKVWCWLKDNADKDGAVHASAATIACALRMNHNTTRHVLARLYKMGIVRRAPAKENRYGSKKTWFTFLIDLKAKVVE